MMTTHYAVCKKKPSYDESRANPFNSLQEARAYRAQKSDKKLGIYIIQDAARFRSPTIKKVPDWVPDSWNHIGWNGVFSKNPFEKTIIRLVWDDAEVVYIDGCRCISSDLQFRQFETGQRISPVAWMDALVWLEQTKYPRKRHHVYFAGKAPTTVSQDIIDFQPEVLMRILYRITQDGRFMYTAAHVRSSSK